MQHYDSMEALENATARGENRNLDFVKGGGKFWDTQPVSGERSSGSCGQGTEGVGSWVQGP